MSRCAQRFPPFD